MTDTQETPQMTQTVQIDGEEYPVADGMEVSELREDAGIDDDRRLCYHQDDGERVVLNEDDLVTEEIPDGGELTEVPLNDGVTFG
jgi:hypothetical protein